MRVERCPRGVELDLRLLPSRPQLVDGRAHEREERLSRPHRVAELAEHAGDAAVDRARPPWS